MLSVAHSPRVCFCVLLCSGTASNIEEAIAISAEIGRFPLIIRPAFTLGGTGGGISYNMEEFKEQVKAGIDASMTDQVGTAAERHMLLRGLLVLPLPDCCGTAPF